MHNNISSAGVGAGALFASANKYEIRRVSPHTRRANIMGVCFGKMITVKIENLGLPAGRGGCY